MKNKNKKLADVKWIFFDLDGTLADTIPALYGVYLDFLKKFEKKGAKKEFTILSGPSLPEIIAKLKSKYNLKYEEGALLKIYQELISFSYTSIRPSANAGAVLQKLNKLNYKLMLVTSADRDIAMKFISNQGWQKYFHNYVLGNEVKNSKPNPAIYNLALEKAGVAPDEAVAIEDSPNGVLSAKRAGSLVIGLAEIETKNTLLEAGADIVVSGLKDILPFF